MPESHFRRKIAALSDELHITTGMEIKPPPEGKFGRSRPLPADAFFENARPHELPEPRVFGRTLVSGMAFSWGPRT